jgi:hypothetical protein
VAKKLSVAGLPNEGRKEKERRENVALQVPPSSSLVEANEYYQDEQYSIMDDFQGNKKKTHIRNLLSCLLIKLSHNRGCGWRLCRRNVVTQRYVYHLHS